MHSIGMSTISCMTILYPTNVVLSALVGQLSSSFFCFSISWLPRILLQHIQHNIPTYCTYLYFEPSDGHVLDTSPTITVLVGISKGYAAKGAVAMLIDTLECQSVDGNSWKTLPDNLKGYEELQKDIAKAKAKYSVIIPKCVALDPCAIRNCLGVEDQAGMVVCSIESG